MQVCLATTCALVTPYLARRVAQDDVGEDLEVLEELVEADLERDRWWCGGWVGLQKQNVKHAPSRPPQIHADARYTEQQRPAGFLVIQNPLLLTCTRKEAGCAYIVSLSSAADSVSSFPRMDQPARPCDEKG